jgi:hypothetical protein
LPLSAARALFGQGHTAGVREFGLLVDLFSPTVVSAIGRSSFPDDSRSLPYFNITLLRTQKPSGRAMSILPFTAGNPCSHWDCFLLKFSLRLIFRVINVKGWLM